MKSEKNAVLISPAFLELASSVQQFYWVYNLDIHNKW